MEDLKKLMADVSVKANEVLSLRKQKEDSQNEIMAKLAKNYKDWFIQDASELKNFIENTLINHNMVSHLSVVAYLDGNEIKVKKYTRQEKYQLFADSDGNNQRDLELPVGTFSVCISTSDSLESLSVGYGSRDETSNPISNAPCENNNWYYAKYWTKHFMTVENTIKRADVMRKAYSVFLEHCAENCDERIANLKNTLKELSETLSGSTSVTEKEDGTIELTLNGKTYVGTVKESK